MLTETQQNAKTVAATGSLLGVVAVFLPSFLTFRPNRLFGGVSKSALHSIGPWGWALLAVWAIALIISLLPAIPLSARGLIAGILGGAGTAVALYGAGHAAAVYAVAKGDITRVSFGPGIWLTFLASTLVIYAASAWTPRRWQIFLISYLPFVGVALLLLTGSLSALSILREYANNSADFIAQLQRHLLYTVGATAGGIIIGIPLGLIAAGSKRAESAIFGTLNVLNVLPVLAFIGLLNPVLTWLSNSIPVVAALQISGVGWMPIIIVLTVYATYPIARNTYTAMLTLDPSTIDAANGIGMDRARLLFEVKLPLGMPVIIAGIRIALVQTTAGAIIAGLVGGGGLGTFVFLGASQTAMDLVLLGTIPIVFLGLFFDRFALGVQNLFNRWSTARD